MVITYFIVFEIVLFVLAYIHKISNRDSRIEAVAMIILITMVLIAISYTAFSNFVIAITISLVSAVAANVTADYIALKIK